MHIQTTRDKEEKTNGKQKTSNRKNKFAIHIWKLWSNIFPGIKKI